MRGARKVIVASAAALLLAGLLISGASASAGRAKTLHTELVFSFNKQVVCGVNVKQLGGVTCASAALPSTELDGFALLHRHGRTQLGERGDSPFQQGSRGTLSKGRRWARVGVVCVRKPGAVRCHNEDGHGIRLAPKAFKTF